MARTFGFRGFNEVFRDLTDDGSKTTEFRGPGMFGRVIVFGPGGRPTGERAQARAESGHFGEGGNRLAQYVLKKVMRPRNGRAGDPTNDHPGRARGGPGRQGRLSRREEVAEGHDRDSPGIREGQMIRLKGMGSGPDGGGDLYLKVEIRRPLLRKVREFLKGRGVSERDP